MGGFKGDAAGQRRDGCLRRSVVGHHRCTPKACDGSHVDDHAVARGRQVRQRLLDEGHGRVDVQRHRLAPPRQPHGGHRYRETVAAGVVDQNVQPTECRHRFGDQTLRGPVLGHIGGDGNGTSAGLLDRISRLLNGVGTPRGQRNRAAVARQLLGDCAPDPARRPRDECCASGQVMRVETVVVCHRLPFD